MAVTLSFGYILNQTGDRGSVFFPDLEFNIQRLNSHNHNGLNSDNIPSSSVVAVTQLVNASGWLSLGGGTFHQVITVPAGIDLDGKLPFFFDSNTNKHLNLGYEILSDTTFDVLSNDNTLELKIYYL